LLNRREFVTASSAAALGALMSRDLLAQPRKDVGSSGGGRAVTLFEWKPIAPDLASIKVAFGQGGNVTLIDGKEVAYLIDTKNSPWGKTLRREASPGAPKLVVINTHHHADHTGGNHAFTGDCDVLAHEKCLPRIEGNVARYISQIKEAVGNFPKGESEGLKRAREDWTELYHNVTKLEAKNFTPTEAVKDTHEIATPGGAKISLRHFGPGHTDNDLVLHLPNSNVLIVGDLVFRKVFPYVDQNGGGTIEGWISALKQAQALCDKKTRVVPGHGDLCGPEGIADQITYFEKCRDAVAKAIKAGRQRKDIVTMKLPFHGYANEDRQSMTMIQLYAELSEKK